MPSRNDNDDANMCRKEKQMSMLMNICLYLEQISTKLPKHCEKTYYKTGHAFTQHINYLNPNWVL